MKPVKGRKAKKRYPAPHSLLKGLRGQACNNALDFAISMNKWCATFKDEEKVTVDLVDECIVTAWLRYICDIVRSSYPFTQTPLRQPCIILYVNHI